MLYIYSTIGYLHCTCVTDVINSELFAFKKFSIGGDFKIKRDFNAHEFLVLSELVSHLRFEFFKFVGSLTELVLEVVQFRAVAVFHLIHAVTEGVVGTAKGFNFDLKSLLSLSVLVDLFSSISKRSSISSTLLISFTNFLVSPLVHFLTVFSSKFFIISTHSIQFFEKIWTSWSLDLNRFLLSQLFSEFTNFFFVAASEKLDFFDSCF